MISGINKSMLEQFDCHSCSHSSKWWFSAFQSTLLLTGLLIAEQVKEKMAGGKGNQYRNSSNRRGLTLEEGTIVTAQDAVGHVDAGNGNATGVMLGGDVRLVNVIASVASQKARGNLVGAKVGERGTVVVRNFISYVNVGRNNVINYR